MNMKILLAGACFLCAAVACRSTGETSRCMVRQIEEVVRNPLNYAGRVFCGEVFAVRYGATARILSSPSETPPSIDLAMVVTSRTRHMLVGLSEEPQRFYIEARVDPQTDCFVAREGAERCFPYRRPVFMHVVSSQPRPLTGRPN